MDRVYYKRQLWQTERIRSMIACGIAVPSLNCAWLAPHGGGNHLARLRHAKTLSAARILYSTGPSLLAWPEEVAWCDRACCSFKAWVRLRRFVPCKGAASTHLLRQACQIIPSEVDATYAELQCCLQETLRFNHVVLLEINPARAPISRRDCFDLWKHPDALGAT